MDKVALGSDHAGYELKTAIKKVLQEMNVQYEDFGTNSTDSCDYPDYARVVSQTVAQGGYQKGILCCGSGVGVSIVANKTRGIRAALCRDAEDADLARKHNDANVLCLSGRKTDPAQVPEIVKAFLTGKFEGGRHQARVEKIEKLRAVDYSM